MRNAWLWSLVFVAALVSVNAHAEYYWNRACGHQCGGYYASGRPSVPFHGAYNYPSSTVLALAAELPQTMQQVAPTPQAQPRYDAVEGMATTTSGFSDGQLWVDSFPVQAGPGAIVIFEDGSRARYADVYRVLPVPRKIRVYKYSGGNSFAYVQLLPW